MRPGETGYLLGFDAFDGLDGGDPRVGFDGVDHDGPPLPPPPPPWFGLWWALALFSTARLGAR